MTTINTMTSPFQMNSVQTAKQYITELHKDHDAWLAAEQSAGTALVGVLVKCLRLYELMAGDSEDAEQLRSDFTTYVKSTKLRFNGETHTVAKIAGVVFNRHDEKYNRRHASHYGRVLRVALKSGVPSDQLATFIEKNGGVTKLAQPTPSNGPTTETKADEVWAAVRHTKLATISGDGLRNVADAANVGQRVLLLATQLANATFDVHALVQKVGIVHAAFATKHAELGADDVSVVQADPDAIREKLVAEATA